MKTREKSDDVEPGVEPEACPSQRCALGNAASACSTWLPQPVQVALPQLGQVAGEHIKQPF